ncbi:MAG: adenylate kinase [Lachnospiraceae bacterium]|nr:adenylate kinase [Lachnospiraceae bacterium]
MIIGSPGSGKSTFARKLRDKSGLPLFYLDMINHKPDRTEISSEDFDVKLREILNLHEWIIDGNYQRTLEIRMKEADMIILFDLPTEVCLEGAIARIGTKREDMPWTETENDLESGFRQWIEEFSVKKLPEIYALLEKHKEKDIVIFKCREEADDFAQNYGTSCVGEII